MSDRNVPMLVRVFEKRLRAYRAMGYEIDASLKDDDVDDAEPRSFGRSFSHRRNDISERPALTDEACESAPHEPIVQA